MTKRPLILVPIGLALLGLIVAGLLVARRPTLSPTPAAPPTAPTLPPRSPVPEPTVGLPDPFTVAREAMVREQIAARDVRDEAVLTAMRRTPRHRFVPPEQIAAAYEDHPLPIGYGQTISQPYIVALMTEALKVKPGDRVLEIGTGSGYQAAILADLGCQVYTVEIIPELARQAEARLADLGYGQVKVLSADGYYGWPEHAPFDAIIVTAAPDHLPQPLGSQLKEGGRLIVPIGPQGAVQTLWLFEKRGGQLEATNLGGVLFVPLTGKGH